MSRPTALVVCRDLEQQQVFNDLLHNKFHILHIRSIEEINLVGEDTEIQTVVIALDKTQPGMVDLHSFFDQWASKATIIFVPDSPDSAQLIAFKELLKTLGSAQSIPLSSTGSRTEQPAYQPAATTVRKPSRQRTDTLALSPHQNRFQRLISRWRLLFGDTARIADQTATPPPPQSARADGLPGIVTKSTLISGPVIRNTTPHANSDSLLALNGFMLGPFHLILQGNIISKWPSRKGKSMLAYLLYNRRHKNMKDVLMEKFWPDVEAESARNSLNVAMCGLRKLFKQIDPTTEYIQYKDDGYFVNPEIDMQLDIERFMRYLQQGQQLERSEGTGAALEDYERAIDIYKGDFLSDELYDDWSFPIRESVRESFLFILDRMSDFYCTVGDYARASTLCETILTKDGCREVIHRRLMHCYYHVGLRAKAIKQFHKCEEALKSDLDVIPSRQTLHLYEKIRKEDL